MTHYTEQETHWMKSRALEFFLNFIKNHDAIVNDRDTFELAAELQTHEQWIDLIKKSFPARTLERIQKKTELSSDLDFTDPSEIIIQKIWCIEHTRKKMRLLLSKVVKEEIRKNPPENYVHETFAQRTAELQRSLKLNDMEINILLVLAFVRNDFLCIVNEHDRRTNTRDRAVFVAKSLDCPLSEIVACLDEKSKLRRYQCIDEDLDFNSSLFHFLNGFSEEPLTSIFFTKNKEETLPWSFYGTLAEKHGELIERIISSCDGTRSAHILLYGTPGTGKSSFAKTLAERLHRTCYMIRTYQLIIS